MVAGVVDDAAGLIQLGVVADGQPAMTGFVAARLPQPELHVGHHHRLGAGAIQAPARATSWVRWDIHTSPKIVTPTASTMNSGGPSGRTT